MHDTNDDLRRLEVLRYEMLPRPHLGSPGYSGVRLVLPARAAGHELQTVVLIVVDWQGQPCAVCHIHAETAAMERQVVAPGDIYTRSHEEAEGAFYTYGGALNVTHLAGEAIVTIRSDAPLLELAPRQETLANLLAAEAEGLLSQVEAAQGWQREQLRQRLAAAGARAVYLAVLQSLLAHYTAADALSHLHPELVALLHNEKQWYVQSGQWGVPQPDLATLAAALQ